MHGVVVVEDSVEEGEEDDVVDIVVDLEEVVEVIIPTVVAITSFPSSLHPMCFCLIRSTCLLTWEGVTQALLRICLINLVIFLHDGGGGDGEKHAAICVGLDLPRRLLVCTFHCGHPKG